MALATWWATDPMPSLPKLDGFDVALAADDTELAFLNHLTVTEIQARRSEGHRPYIGYIKGVPAAYGWVATRQASIGELDLTFNLPTGHRYLWDFATRPERQGWGIYPRLLQAILAQETYEAARFWIIHAPENLPSGAGMHKAGFMSVGQLSFRRDGSVGLLPLNNPARGRIGAALLGVPVIEEDVNPCWGCMERVVCTCQLDPDSCSCGVAVRPSVQLAR
ncbi:MAG: GNAT family N-acetyltransferase [Anaerolineae bacterium]|nr:GNAT family N-acetyltransferase [Anaerolineae bacterium]